MTDTNGYRNSVQATSMQDPLLYELDNPMSKDRRKFVIICVFDCVLITVLWLIGTVTKGDDWPRIFLHEINLFEADFLQISLFDIVILGFLRMAVLLVFYAGLRVDHWLPVACTTSISTIFIVVKILFFFKKNHGGLPQVVLLASLSIAWFELWIVPFRVLSRERRAYDEVSVASSTRSLSRSSFLRPNRRLNRRLLPQSEDEFRSALEYTTDEERSPEIGLNPTIILPGYGYIVRHTAFTLLDDAYCQVRSMLMEVESWKVMNRSPEIRNKDNIFYVRQEFSCEPRTLFLAAWRDVQLWNPQLVRMDYLYKFDAERDVVHSESSPALGGYVSSRHFIDIRRVVHDIHSKSYNCVYVSIPTQNKPEEMTGGVRGVNGPNLVRITRVSENSKKSLFEWIMNTDVKSQIPKMLMRRGTITFLTSYPELLAHFVASKGDDYGQNV